jgi:tetrapyrrole methylase family protein/MazG family protein
VKEVLTRWEKIKQGEKGSKTRKSITDGIPLALPALQKAQKLQKKIAKVGFEWDSVDGVIEKIEEELSEVKEAINNKEEEKISEEIGDLMFSVVNLARYTGKEAEYLLHDAIKKFTQRFKKVEKALKKEKKTLEGSSLSEMEALWNKFK